MRDDLDNVEWGSLRTFNRMADHVPRLLRGLCANDAQERERAAALLETALTGQGELYEAAPYAVPFLLRLVRERAVGAPSAYRVLYEIGRHNALGPEASRFRLPGWHVETMSLRDACREAVRSGMDLFLRDAEDPAINYRREAFELLLSFYFDDERVRERLPTLLERENDVELRAELLDVLASL
jgi:hypothetical protein